LAGKLAKKLDLDADGIKDEMQSGDYDNLLSVFNENFGDYVQLISPHEIPGIGSELYTIEECPYL